MVPVNFFSIMYFDMLLMNFIGVKGVKPKKGSRRKVRNRFLYFYYLQWIYFLESMKYEYLVNIFNISKFYSLLPIQGCFVNVRCQAETVQFTIR